MRIECQYYRKIWNKTLNEFVFVPCGKCYACKVRQAREWQIRAMCEVPYWDKFCFLTLTYNNEHLPSNGSLCKRDLQLFFKRLRKHIHNETIAYLACGEYGTKRGRPHYHALIFGWCPDDIILDDGNTQSGYQQYISPTLERLWSDDNGLIGRCRVSVDNYNAKVIAGYIARYTTKKRGKVCLQYGQQPEFTLASRRIPMPDGSFGAIGKRYLLDYTNTCARGFLNDSEDAFKKLPLPRYFTKFLEDNVAYQAQKERRRILRESKMANLHNPSYEDWLDKAKYAMRLDASNPDILPRNFDENF